MGVDARGTGLLRVRSVATIGRRGVLAGGAALAGLAALGAGRARAQETTVTFLGWQGYDEGLKAGGFLEESGIALNTTYIGNNDEIIARLSAGGVGQVDLVTPYMGYIPLMVAAGLIDPVDEALVPNLAHVIEPFRDDPNLIVDGVRYAVPFTWGSAPMLYDPAALPTPPAGWNDLLDPSLQGRVGMMDDPLGNIMDAALAVTSAQSPTQLTPDELAAAIDFLIQMKAQSRIYAASWGELADALARSEIVATFSGWETIQKFAADKGKAVAIHWPVEGTHAWLDSYVLVKDAPNREAAHRLANKIIDVDAQVMIGDELLQGIVNGDAIARLTTSRAIYAYDDLEGFAAKAGFFAFPPLDPVEGLTTWADWQDAYQRFRAA